MIAEQFEIVNGRPTPAELAAVTAVISSLADKADELRSDRVVVSGWQRTQRSLRQRLHPHAGAWRSFSG